ncbi:sigma-70 family RNA polymerase sigma factor [Maribellus luteus]|uniref:Sigma-70 family RNA polymerase sigma factor n=1 Tax=Maribellus luteus TaxID=2305463 RepID=A0A399SUL1_9BACT|nr:sigma-70 family RNA polymerase sigma factor [Maribellus luteus]RIJ45655.1 sigma-70 family RNA polymerase sigma factor [Maribellus luteus]
MQVRLDDGNKWDRFRQGDNSCFADIYSEIAPRLYWYGLKFTSNQNIIEDVIQDLFSDLFSKRKTLGPTDNILFYLMCSFKRKLFRLLKKEDKTSTDPLSDDYSFQVNYSIEQEIIKEEVVKEQTRLLAQALKKLPSRQKESIYLKYHEGLGYEEIAELMDISVESCRNLISKAIKALRQSIHQPSQLIALLIFIRQ